MRHAGLKGAIGRPKWRHAKPDQIATASTGRCSGSPTSWGMASSRCARGARFTGTAPIPVWSGTSTGKVRLNRGGNRTINTALHMIAVTQSRGYGPGRAYLDRLTGPGKGRTEAVRLLRRRLSDAVFSALRIEERRYATASDHTTSEQRRPPLDGRTSRSSTANTKK